jgi:glycosyltransferase involved in cell wall biosynthesis
MGSIWAGGQAPSLNGSSALQRREGQRRPILNRVLLAPQRKTGDEVSWSGQARLLDSWKSAPLQRKWGSDVVTELPAAGTGNILVLQAGAPLAEIARIAPWLGQWRHAGGKLVLEYTGDATFPDAPTGAANAHQERDLRWLARAADAVIVPSAAAAESLRATNANVFVIPTYLDARTWSVGRAKPAPPNAFWRKPAHPVRIGFIGAASERPHLELIAPALIRLEHELGERISVEVIGAFERTTPLFGQRIGLTKKQAYADYVLWLQQRVDWDIGIVPVRVGSELAGDAGHKILQYAALGVATLASNCAVARELVQHQKSGLLVENDVEAWCLALRRLVEDAELRRRLVAGAQGRLEQSFTVQANSQKYLDLLAKVRSLPQRSDVPALPGTWSAWKQEQWQSVLAAASVASQDHPQLRTLERKGRKLARDPRAFLTDSRLPLLQGIAALLPRSPQPRRLQPGIVSAPPSLAEKLARKGKKLSRDPQAFFADSRSPLVRRLGSVVVPPYLAIHGPSKLTSYRATPVNMGRGWQANTSGQMSEPVSSSKSDGAEPFRVEAMTSEVSPDSGGPPSSASGGLTRPEAKSVHDARKLLLKIEKTVLGNWNALARKSKAPPRLDSMAGTDVPSFAEALYASTHAQQLQALSKEVSHDVAAMKQFLTNLPEARSFELSGPGSEYAAELRAKILQAIPKVASQRHTPYYSRLADAVSGLADPQLLSEVWRTLHDVDLARYGHVPRPVGPLVSVIMPAHNRRDVVGDAVGSVLAQTYPNFELLVCDDASADDTRRVLTDFSDARVTILQHEQRQGAAAARNTCLRAAHGKYVAYLDSDNLWHPRFLELMLEELERRPGHVAGYASYFDVQLNELGDARLKKAEIRSFYLEDQLEVPFVDLNSFVHRRELGEVFGYFDERLVRRQDYDIISRYCWIREPHHLPRALNIYQRNPSLEQITRITKGDVTAPALIKEKIDSYYTQGLPVQFPPWLKKVSVISWDMSRNHFAKAYCVAEALSEHLEVELISFRFFDTPIFEPLADAKPKFEIKSFEGGDFPAFFENFSKAVNAITGDVIYAVKPRLSSLGVAMMANYHTGKPIFLEVNDLETVVAAPRVHKRHVEVPLDALLHDLEQAKTPHSLIWSQALDPCVAGIPTVYTHNVNLDIHYGRRCLYMRNIKDDTLYDPARMDRSALRSELGFGPEDRIILFGGLVRRHKGVFELVELLKTLGDPRYKLLIVASRETPEVRALASQHADQVTLLPPQPPARMAELNHASDLVVLWLDPNVAAGHYQSPYKISDALAMGPAIIASPTSDLANFSERDLVWMVPFGDFVALQSTIKAIFADEDERSRRRQRGRRLFLREFSYKSVAASLALGASLVGEADRVYPVSAQFAQFFNDFHQRLSP